MSTAIQAHKSPETLAPAAAHKAEATKPAAHVEAISKVKPAANVEEMHASKTTAKPVINLGHLKQFNSAEGENIGQVSLRDKQTGKNVNVDVVSSKQDDGQETYKLVLDGKVIAFREIKIHIAKPEDKKDKSRISLEFVAVKDNRYGGVLKAFNGIVAQRMRELEAEKKTEFKTIELTTSWNSGKSHLDQEFALVDHKEMSAKKADAVIAKGIADAGSAEKTNTEALGCITMYLPKSAALREEVAKAPIFDAKDKEFTKGTIELTKKDGTKIKAEVTKTHDDLTGMDLYKISHEGKDLGTIQLNYMKLNEKGQVKDYCGTYEASSPFSQYGNGYMFGWGAKKPASKVFIEMHQTLSDEFKDLDKALLKIPVEIATGDKKTFGGRVMAEADWGTEPAIFYDAGLRTQKYRGLTKAEDLKKAYETEIKAAQKEGRLANLKQFGSQKMTMSRKDMLAKFPNPLISTQGHQMEAKPHDDHAKDKHAAQVAAHAA